MVICYTAITMNIFIIFLERYIAQCIASGWSPRCFIKEIQKYSGLENTSIYFLTHGGPEVGSAVQAGFPLHIYSGTHVSPILLPLQPHWSPKESWFHAWSKMGPRQTGRRRGQNQNTSFNLSEWCRSRTQHFHSHSILENWVLWPQTHNPHTHKFGLWSQRREGNAVLGWSKARERMDLC